MKSNGLATLFSVCIRWCYDLWVVCS